MNRYEEELQNNLDAGKDPEGDPLDLKAYQTVFNALKKESDFSLSTSFADNVVGLVIKKQKSKSIIREYFWLGFGIFLLLTASMITIVLTAFEFNFGFLNALNSYKGLIVFGILFITLLHWLDRRLIKSTETN
jgi:hypothetical protein